MRQNKNLLLLLSAISFLVFFNNCKKDKDVFAPNITLIGGDNYLVLRGSVYIEPGATAVDNTDGDISEDIKIEGSVNTSLAGTYTITYTVADHAGNNALKTRTVIVTFNTSQMAGLYNVTDSTTTLGVTTVNSYVLTCYSPAPVQLTMTNLHGASGNVTHATTSAGSFSIISSVLASGSPLKVAGTGAITQSGSEITINISYTLTDTLNSVVSTCKAFCISQ